MQYVLALILAGATAWIITLVGSGTIERAASAFALLVGGWRSDPWPRGVQEEDRDRPWGWRVRRALRSSSLSGIDDRSESVATRPVRSRTSRR